MIKKKTIIKRKFWLCIKKLQIVRLNFKLSDSANVCFLCMHGNNLPVFQPWPRSLLTFQSSMSLRTTSLNVFLGRPLPYYQQPTTLTFTVTETLSRWLNHQDILGCKHCLVLFNCILFLSSPGELLSSGILLHNHLTILAPFLSSLITSSSLTGQVSLIWHSTNTQAEYNLIKYSRMHLLLESRLCWLTKVINL